MVAKELMIGDWVNIDIVTRHSLSPTRIETLDKDSINGEDNRNFTPVPLTPEILEKNGWWLDFWWEHKEHPFFLVKYADGSWANGKFGVMFEPDDGDPAFLVGSVHELQHALRMCGLWELANNFKVE